MKFPIVLSLVLVPILSAQTINVDFSASSDAHSTGPGILPGSGPAWNRLVRDSTAVSRLLATVLTGDDIPLLSVSLNANGLSLGIDSEAGRTYLLQYSSGLPGDSWVKIDEATAVVDGFLLLLDPGAATRERAFYRVARGP